MVKKPIQAVFENGLLRPLAPLHLKEGETVTISVQEQTEIPDVLALAQRVYEGLSAEEVDEIERIALDRKDFFGQR